MAFHSSTYGYPIFLAPVMEVTAFSLRSVFGTVVRGQAAAAVWVDFWALCSATLVCTSVFVAAAGCLCHCSII